MFCFFSFASPCEKLQWLGGTCASHVCAVLNVWLILVFVTHASLIESSSVCYLLWTELILLISVEMCASNAPRLIGIISDVFPACIVEFGRIKCEFLT